VDVYLWRQDNTVRAEVRRKLGLDSEFLWFAAGRLEPVKDYPALLHAMAGLPESARLVIAGGGPEESRLRHVSAELGLEHRVRFLGFDPNVRRWMQAADGFVLSSLWEGLPMALLEAAACSVPAVATDVLGTREVIVNGQTGLLGVAGSALALREAMSRIMSIQPEERRAMGDRARVLAVERFSLDKVLDRWEELYTSLLDRNPVSTRWGKPEP